MLDKELWDKDFNFSSMVDSWNETGMGHEMFERVSPEAFENCDVVDLGVEASEPPKSLALRGLVENPSSTDDPSNLTVLGRYIPRQSVGFA